MWIVDGLKLAEDREVALKAKIIDLNKQGIELAMVSLVMADDDAGQMYTRLKKAAADRVGIRFLVENLSEWDEAKIGELIAKYNSDKSIGGMMIQRPGGAWRRKHNLSFSQFDSQWQRLVGQIDRHKDVDGLRADSPFTLAVVKAAEAVFALMTEKEAPALTVVVGAKGFVGKVLVERLKQAGNKVQGADFGDDLKAICQDADVVISAVGKKDLIKAEMVKEGVKVIDIGWPKPDVERAVYSKAAAVTPVPGGVGPLTVIALLENLYDAGYNSQITHAG